MEVLVVVPQELKKVLLDSTYVYI